jgi:(E)-4-hydroxy-3-methylbut-2-enyl-diphosphate synthase
VLFRSGLLPLLRDGIGATLRVSLSDTMENEVIAGREILLVAAEATRKPAAGVKIISCPKCGRATFDTHAFTARWLNELYCAPGPGSVAIMGCPVNGPGEARDADLGITGAGESVLVFKKGEIMRRAPAGQADAVFRAELDAFAGRARAACEVR